MPGLLQVPGVGRIGDPATVRTLRLAFDRLTALDQRLVLVEQQLDAAQGRLDDLAQRLATIETQLRTR